MHSRLFINSIKGREGVRKLFGDRSLIILLLGHFGHHFLEIGFIKKLLI
jgi:hypothetical protein